MPEEIVEGGPAPAPSPTPTPTPTPSPTPAPAPAPSGSADWERQRSGLTADLAKERKQRQQFEQQYQTAQAELASERKRVQALAGLTPQSPEEADAAEIRDKFGKVFSREQLLAHLGLSQEDLDGMKGARASQKAAQDIEQRHWTRHAKEMFSSVAKEVAKEYGELSKAQTDAINQQYALRCQADEAFAERHEAGDPTLAADFAKEWLTTWFEPAKRRALATNVNQFRPVPNGQNRSIVNQGDKKIDVNNNDEVMNLLVAGRTFEPRR